jgi:hypothetical protein
MSHFDPFNGTMDLSHSKWMLDLSAWPSILQVALDTVTGAESHLAWAQAQQGITGMECYCTPRELAWRQLNVVHAHEHVVKVWADYTGCYDHARAALVEELNEDDDLIY